ncbi:hypothetical protein [Clostridium oryzae]|uniref:Hydrogenase nickel incorporation protein HypA n=1 Tax=Clostridium oryzae TaxID=1450648 RepID=A0A1V4IMC6_9CLOT|nr:hypothetical protein [Clostridium oryzae]OPJ60980.1 hypothetical protein CLORY_25290 [Clostridium oryzae]
MHDTILLNKISQALNECCKTKNFYKINRLVVNVNERSHLNAGNLHEYLKNYNEGIVDDDTDIEVRIEDLPDQIAILRNIEGEIAE